MKLAIIGTGYVGLPAGACFADFGNNVICVDKIKEKIEVLNKGEIPLYEPGLKEIVEKNLNSGNLKFTTDLKNSVKNANVIMLAVGTPTNPKNEHADLTYIKKAVEEIAEALSIDDGYKVIATKSTVPIGTNEMLAKLINKTNPNIEFDTVSIPEFLREGKAVPDFINPDRIIIGVENKKAKKIIEELYSPFSSKNIPIIYCNRKSAEMIKYASNAFLGVKISFINELADLCEKQKADIRDVAKGIGLDTRIGTKFLNPGPGFGGSCFPKDMLEILTTSQELDSELLVVKSAIDYNTNRSEIIVKKIEKIFNGNLSGKTIGILGLAFKAETDDMRMSPIVPIIKKLVKKDVEIKAFDPQAMENAKEILPDINYTKNLYEATENIDLLIIATEWNEFKNLDFNKLSSNMNSKTILDLRNILSVKEVLDAGFDYNPIGFSIKK